MNKDKSCLGCTAIGLLALTNGLIKLAERDQHAKFTANGSNRHTNQTNAKSRSCSVHNFYNGVGQPLWLEKHTKHFAPLNVDSSPQAPSKQPLQLETIEGGSSIPATPQPSNRPRQDIKNR